MSIVNFINKDTGEIYFEPNVARYFIDSLKYRPVEKFRNMNASVVPWHTVKGFHFLDPNSGEVIEFQATALRSYNTMVCCYISVILSDNEVHYYFIEWRGYSRTTSKQVTFFRRMVENSGYIPEKTFTFKGERE